MCGRFAQCFEVPATAHWLDPGNQHQARLTALLQPCPGERLIGYPVARSVGQPRFDAPECLVPTGPLIDAPADQLVLIP